MKFLGHEIWIEGPEHGHLDSPCNLFLKYGHNLALDGHVDISQVKATLVDPGGNISDLILFWAPDLPTDEFVVSFTPLEEGYYTVWLDHKAGIWCEGVDERWYYAPKNSCPPVRQSLRYRQLSKVIIPAGHSLAPTTPAALDARMDIVPHDYRLLSEGEELTVQVIYQGSPLPEANLRIASTVKGQAYEVQADRYGQATVRFDSFGFWMILASYDDYSLGVPGEFEGEQFSAVLSLMVRP